MKDIFSADSRGNVAEFTVSEISGALKRTVEDAFGHVRVRGEISGYRGPHSSGHAYFALKDERAKLEAVVWKMTMARLKFRPEEGMEVIATGKLTTYPGSSKYQIVIDNLEPAGAGALMALLEERKKRLAAEGLFAQERKKRLPFMPCTIGVITSPTGAVIRDIIHRIKDRFPLHVLVWPVRVQGETAAAEVTAAVNGFNALPDGGAIPRPDVVIVARGGGSLEDLWGFNDEDLARAVAASIIPVISAVGHETDWTLVDLVADMRAPTPTGAAEFAVPVKAELELTLTGLSARLKACVRRGLDRRRDTLRAAGRALPSPDQLFAISRRKFDEASTRLERGLTVSAERKRAQLGALRLQPQLLSRRIGEARKLTDRDLARAQAALRGQVGERRRMFARVAARLRHEPLVRHQSHLRTTLSTLDRRMEHAITLKFERLRTRTSQTDRLLSTLSHQGILERGFALVSDADGRLLTRAVALSSGMALTLRFADGMASAVATGGDARPKPRASATKAKTPGGQGTLF